MKNLQITGNLVRDAEVKVTPKGSQFLVFKVGCTGKAKGEDKTDFIEVISFNLNDIQVLAQYLKKGSLVYVYGQFDLSTSIGKDGRVYANLSVVAKDIQFVGGGKKNNENGGKTEEEPSISVTAQPEAPAATTTDYSAIEAQTTMSVTPPPAEAATGADEDDDELPF